MSTSVSPEISERPAPRAGRAIIADLLDADMRSRAERTMHAYRDALRGLSLRSSSPSRADESTSLYHVLPWMFDDAIPGLTEEQLGSLAVAGLQYFGHVLIVDRMIDGDTAITRSLVLDAHALHEAALVTLASAGLLGAASAGAISGVAQEYASAVHREKSVSLSVKWTDYVSIAIGKAPF